MENQNKTINSEPINDNHSEILEWVKNVKFQKKLIGGIDETDVWRKIKELNNLYEKALIAEREKLKAENEQSKR